MPVTVLKNNRGNFVNVSSQMGFQNTRGWWNCLVSADLNHDGLPDFIAGNHGLNSFFKAKDRMYVYDFDGNGAVEQVFCTQVGKRYYPVVDKDDFVAQMPGLKKKLLYYKDYANMAIDDLFSEPLLSNSKQFEIDVLSSVLLLSGEKGYSIIPLPVEAQYSSIYSLKLFDVDKDGITDLLAGGNQFNVKPQFGKFDGSFGWFFKGKINDGKFSFESGRSLGIKGQIRDIEVIEHDKQTIIIFSKYDDELEFFKVNQ